MDVQSATGLEHTPLQIMIVFFLFYLFLTSQAILGDINMVFVNHKR